MKETLRKEVRLHKDVVARLQKLADKRRWSLKQYMETVLINNSHKLKDNG